MQLPSEPMIPGGLSGEVDLLDAGVSRRRRRRRRRHYSKHIRKKILYRVLLVLTQGLLIAAAVYIWTRVAA